MNKKAVFLDIDGTLIDRDGSLPASAKEALERARQNGHEMVICSGRSFTQVEAVITLADFDGIVCSAGANVRRGGEIIWRGSMERERVQQLVDFFRENHIAYFLQAESGIYAEEYCVKHIMQAFANVGFDPKMVDDAFGQTTVMERPEDVPHIEKCCYFQCTMEAEEVQKALGPYYQVVDSSYKLTRFCDGEVVKEGCNKATGMEKYLEAAGIPHEDCIAFGDGPNDLEMLEYAHLGVCMGNGTDRTKAVADMVCGRIDEDGLYNAFRKLELI